MEYKIVLYCGLFLVFLLGMLLGYLLRAKFHKWDIQDFTNMPIGGIYRFLGMINTEDTYFMLFAKFSERSYSTRLMLVSCGKEAVGRGMDPTFFKVGHSYKRYKDDFVNV